MLLPDILKLGQTAFAGGLRSTRPKPESSAINAASYTTPWDTILTCDQILLHLSAGTKRQVILTRFWTEIAWPSRVGANNRHSLVVGWPWPDPRVRPATNDWPDDGMKHAVARSAQPTPLVFARMSLTSSASGLAWPEARRPFATRGSASQSLLSPRTGDSSCAADRSL